MKCCLLLSQALGEVLLYRLHALLLHLRHLADAVVQGSALLTQVVGGGGVAASLKDLLIEVEEADEPTLAPTGDLSASGQAF